MCYVIPFTLPCCRRTYVSVTKMKDCPADWPKTKCPKELCFQIGSQADDRDDGTCWRCKAAEAGIPQEHRESLRPGIDSADVERFILTPEERRSQMEEDGFCWFCGHRCECESCGPVRIEGVDDSLLGRNRLPPAVEERRPVNKRLKLEHTNTARSKSATSSSKSKSKARPQTRSVSKQISRPSSYSQSPLPDKLDQRAFSPSKGRPNVQHLEPKQEYAGYGDHSHFFSSGTNGMYSTSTPFPAAGGVCPEYVQQSHLLDPRLFEQPSFLAPEAAHQANEKSLMICLQLADSHTTLTKPEQRQGQVSDEGQFDLYVASPPRSQHVYQQSYGQPPVLDFQVPGNGQANSSTPAEWYEQPQALNPRLSNGNDTYLNMPQSYGQPQVFDPALFDADQASLSFPRHVYEQNHQQQTIHYPIHDEPNQLSYEQLHVSYIYPLLSQASNLMIKQHDFNSQKFNSDLKLSNMLSGYNTIHNTQTSASETASTNTQMCHDHEER